MPETTPTTPENKYTQAERYAELDAKLGIQAEVDEIAKNHPVYTSQDLLYITRDGGLALDIKKYMDDARVRANILRLSKMDLTNPKSAKSRKKTARKKTKR